MRNLERFDNLSCKVHGLQVVQISSGQLANDLITIDMGSNMMTYHQMIGTVPTEVEPLHDVNGEGG
jgi:hypothetical protein